MEKKIKAVVYGVVLALVFNITSNVVFGELIFSGGILGRNGNRIASVVMGIIFGLPVGFLISGLVATAKLNSWWSIIWGMLINGLLPVLDIFNNEETEISEKVFLFAVSQVLLGGIIGFVVWYLAVEKKVDENRLESQ